MRFLLLFASVFLVGCVTIKPGNVVDKVDRNNCAVRAVHIDAEAQAMGYASGRIDGTQVTIMNMDACPELTLSLPAPRDSSKTINIYIPGAAKNEE